MTRSSPAEMQRLLAVEFERRGWQYDLDTAHSVVQQVVSSGVVNGAELAARVPATFLRQNRTDRDVLATAIERAIGGRSPEPDQDATVTLVAQDHRQYSLSMNSGAQITGGNVNIGGTQINIQSQAGKDELLEGVRALVRAALTTDWDVNAAQAVSHALEGRDDIAYTDVEEVTAVVVRESTASKGSIRDLINTVVASGLGGALSAGIIAGASQVLTLLH